ncbi:MAG: type I-C CRISPR-associated endonuclease Cas1c [candidate division WOR-3 bacterium]
MKRHHNTLYVTTQGAYLAAEGETVLVRVGQETRLQVPLHMLEGIVCFGRVSCSPPLMGLCADRGVGISFLSEHGKFLARVQGPVSGNVLLRRQQYRTADDPDASARLAQMFVMAKVANSRSVLMRSLRDHPDASGGKEVRKAAGLLARSLVEVQKELKLDRVRGVEGDAARTYFEVFDHLIVVQKEDFRFRERSRRPPMDKVNALLSFVYVLLTHDAVSALEAVGLDPQVGFLHRDRPGRPGLALDLVEEFRPFLADRLVLSLINRKQVHGKGFVERETGGVVMNDETRKTVLVAYQERKKEEITHPFLEEKSTVGMLVHLQALLLARHLRGDLDGYPPFLWK